MTGGTLVVSRAVKLHNYYKKIFDDLGYTSVSITSKEKDGLRMLISDMKPKLVLISANFYKCSTPYMLGELIHLFPEINFAAISIDIEYPPELGMYFLVNGAKGFVSSVDGLDQFYNGLKELSKGKKYISPSVQERINMRSEFPNPADFITKRQIEVLRCICNGFSEKEVAETLAISVRTVSNEKNVICTFLNVRNEKELIRVAIYMKWINPDELIFYGGDFVLKPVPDVKKKFKKKKEKNIKE